MTGKPEKQALNRHKTPLRRDAGLTLLELVVVMAVFALVAIMSLQALSGVMRLRERLSEIATQTGELSRALTLMRQDLKALAPMLFYPPDAPPQSAFVAPSDSDTMTFSVAGQPLLPEEDSLGFGRISWRFDAASGQLLRQSWPVQAPLRADAQGPEVLWLSGVTGFEVQSYRIGQGWQPGDGQLGSSEGSGGTFTTQVPDAIDIRITRASLGPLRLLVSLR